MLSSGEILLNKTKMSVKFAAIDVEGGVIH